jgi:hypothetical protein
MTIFELGFIVMPIFGAMFGYEQHAKFGVSPVMGGFIGAASGLVFILGFMFFIMAVIHIADRKNRLKRRAIVKKESE